MQASSSTGSAEVRVNFASERSADERAAVVECIDKMRIGILRRDSLRRGSDDAFSALVPRPRDAQPVTFADDAPEVVAARAAAEAEQQEFLNATLARPALPPADGLATAFQSATDADVASEVFAIPYDYDWKWSEGSMIVSHDPNLTTGRVSVSVWGKRTARAHAGFGVVVRSDRDHWVTARSLRRSTERGHIWTSGVNGAKAVAEGGTEITVFEGDTQLDAAQTDPWRIQLDPGYWGPSGSKTHDSGGNITSDPLEVNWHMKRGHDYHLNVGAWVYAYWRQGDGGGDTASASATVVADVLAITLTHH